VPDYSTHLSVARKAASAAAEIIGGHYAAHLEARDEAGIDLELKADNTPVTRADKEAEAAIHGIISAAFPGHDFLGEETGRSGTGGEFLWLVDPLDGTRSFVRRYPFFSTQIALMHQGRIVVGVSCAQVFGETAWAVRGGGAWLNDRALQVSSVDSWGDCTLSTGNLATLARGAGWSALGSLVSQVARNRGYGDFYHYHLLAAGKLDLVIESDVNILDIAALSLIVEESGGRFTDLAGQAPGLATTSVLAGNAAMWKQARALL